MLGGDAESVGVAMQTATLFFCSGAGRGEAAGRGWATAHGVEVAQDGMGRSGSEGRPCDGTGQSAEGKAVQRRPTGCEGAETARGHADCGEEGRRARPRGERRRGHLLVLRRSQVGRAVTAGFTTGSERVQFNLFRSRDSALVYVPEMLSLGLSVISQVDGGGVPSAESSRSMRGLGKGVSGKPSPQKPYNYEL